LHYFGRLDDPQGALAKWNEPKDHLPPGRVPGKQHDANQRRKTAMPLDPIRLQAARKRR